MKKAFLFGCTLALVASCAQVSSDEYRRQYSLYGRSDGIFQRPDSHGFDLFANGYRQVSLGKTVYEDFSEYQDGDMFCEQLDGTACQGAAGAANTLQFPSGNIFAEDSIVGQTVLGGADMDAGSLDIAGDQTDDDGLEIYTGIHGTSGGIFVVGEDPDFYMCATVTVADVSGTDDMHIGWRKAGIMNATFDNYTDLASIGPMAGDVKIETILNNGSTTTTDTTANLADGGQDRYCVFVTTGGVVTYSIDGQPPATTAAFTFDDSEELIPFIHLLQASDLSGEIDLTEFETGYGVYPK